MERILITWWLRATAARTEFCYTAATQWVKIGQFKFTFVSLSFPQKKLVSSHKHFFFFSTEYQLQSASPAVNFRTTGGVLDFYVVLGPTPEEVTKQYLDLIGQPFLPPYWSLGFQLSRWGYNSLDAMKAAIDRTLSCRFPLVWRECRLLETSPTTLTCAIKSWAANR